MFKTCVKLCEEVIYINVILLLSFDEWLTKNKTRNMKISGLSFCWVLIIFLVDMSDLT